MHCTTNQNMLRAGWTSTGFEDSQRFQSRAKFGNHGFSPAEWKTGGFLAVFAFDLL